MITPNSWKGLKMNYDEWKEKHDDVRRRFFSHEPDEPCFFGIIAEMRNLRSQYREFFKTWQNEQSL